MGATHECRTASFRAASPIRTGRWPALAPAHAFVEADTGAPGGYRIPGLLRALLEGQLAHEDRPQLTAYASSALTGTPPPGRCATA